VLVDPRACDAEAPRDRRRVDVLRARRPAAKELGHAACDRLDVLSVERHVGRVKAPRPRGPDALVRIGVRHGRRSAAVVVARTSGGASGGRVVACRAHAGRARPCRSASSPTSRRGAIDRPAQTDIRSWARAPLARRVGHAAESGWLARRIRRLGGMVEDPTARLGCFGAAVTRHARALRAAVPCLGTRRAVAAGSAVRRYRGSLSTVIGFSPAAAIGSPQWRRSFLPAGGHGSPQRAVDATP